MNTMYLSQSWKQHLLSEFKKPYMQKLQRFLDQEIKLKKCIYPRPAEYFLAFEAVCFRKVKVVILGQDPYHTPRKAHGLCFSIPKGEVIPPSLLNIFKELKSDLGIVNTHQGCLTSWAQQGVLLLNTILTVEAGKPGSHQKKGWEIFTDYIMELLNNKKKHLVFILWGKVAQKKGEIINPQKHYILKAPHPSPFSANKGFFGCSHFSKTNKYLTQNKKIPINWG